VGRYFGVMMAQVGQVGSAQVTLDRDDTLPTRILQVELTEVDDVQDVEQFSGAGDDTNPPIDSSVVVVQDGKAFKIAIAGQDEITPSSQPGERQMYSQAGGAKMGNIYLKADSTVELSSLIGMISITPTGDVELNNGTDSAIAFARMKTAFDLLRTEINTFVVAFNALVTLFGTHVHTLVTPGVASSGPPPAPGVPAVPATATMDAAESPTVKVP